MDRRRGRRRCRPAGPRPRRGDPAEEDELSALPNRRPGRRPGNPDTREAVLAAARAAFAERGFDGATIRGIAADAGVDPALVHHYFGSKDKLFLAAVDAPADPDDLLPEVLAADRAVLGAAVVRMALHVWDGPARPAGLALIRSAVSNEWTAKLLREFLVSKVLRKVVGSLGYDPDVRAARASLVLSQLMGMVMARYVLRLEPLASASPESIVAAIGPTVQRYLTGDVELPGRPDRHT
ncbi:TetR family transcriptional regulator [Blastococcus jejuensis]|uniref:TetR family transcriptional regulator n=1 Tax=Blastococcus jejuensis TaxID=351224 RepID=A0ABP6PHV8_9ACTN